jgi:hypothetical protein
MWLAFYEFWPSEPGGKGPAVGFRTQDVKQVRNGFNRAKRRVGRKTIIEQVTVTTVSFHESKDPYMASEIEFCPDCLLDIIKNLNIAEAANKTVL